MARLRRVTVCASAGRPCRASELAIKASALTTISISVEMLRASSPGRLLLIRSSARAWTAAGSRSGMAAAILCRRPSASVSRNGHELGHSVPPTSTIATSRALVTGHYHRLNAAMAHGRGITWAATDGDHRRLAGRAGDLGGRPAEGPRSPAGRPRPRRQAEDRDRLRAHRQRGTRRVHDRQPGHARAREQGPRELDGRDDGLYRGLRTQAG